MKKIFIPLFFLGQFILCQLSAAAPGSSTTMAKIGQQVDGSEFCNSCAIMSQFSQGNTARTPGLKTTFNSAVSSNSGGAKVGPGNVFQIQDGPQGQR